MKYLMSFFLLVTSTFSFASPYFAEFDVLNPVFAVAGTSHSLRNDFRFGENRGEWQWALRYAHELGVPGDTVGANIKAKDGDAHHLGVRASFKLFDDIQFGGGYLYTLFNSKTEFNGTQKSLNSSNSGFEIFAHHRFDFKDWFLKSELSYHHIFGNFKLRGPSGFSEYDVGQGKLLLLVGKDF